MVGDSSAQNGLSAAAEPLEITGDASPFGNAAAAASPFAFSRDAHDAIASVAAVLHGDTPSAAAASAKRRRRPWRTCCGPPCAGAASGAILCFSFGVILTYVLAGAQVPGGLVMAKLVVYTATWALCAVVGAIGGAAAVRHVLRRLGGRRLSGAAGRAREGGAFAAALQDGDGRSAVRLLAHRTHAAPRAVGAAGDTPLGLEFLAHLFDAGVALPFPGYCAAANATQIIADGTGSGQDVRRRARRRLLRRPTPPTPPRRRGACAGQPRPAAVPRRRRRRCGRLRRGATMATTPTRWRRRLWRS